MLGMRLGIARTDLEACLDQVGQVEKRKVESGRPDIKLAQLGL